MERESQRNTMNRESLDLSGVSISGTRARNGEASADLNSSGTWGSFNHSAFGETGSPSSFGILKSPSSSSSSRAHRGPYARPANLNQSFSRDTSRYSPYSRKPIMVGAREVQADTSNSSNPLLTTSAQRLMEIMHRSSTPVVDGRKVSLSSPCLKSLKPSFSTLKQELGGPPIVRSPLELGNGGRAYPTRGITAASTPSIPPNRVNSSTNTPPDETDEVEKTSGGGKMRTSRPKVPRTNLYSSSSTALAVNGVPKTSPRFTVSRNRKGKRVYVFPFRACWSSATYSNAGAGQKTIESAEAAGPSDETDSKFAITNGTVTPPPPAMEPIKVEPLPLPVSNVKAKEWECPDCLVFNHVSKANCVCCTHPRPAGYAPAGNDEANEPEKKPEPPIPAFQFGFSAPPKVEPNATTSLFTFGEAPKSEPASGSAPGFGNTTTTSSPIKTEEKDKTVIATYNCKECWITNKVTDPKCLACETPRPAEYDSLASAAGGDISKPEPAKPAFTGFRFGITTPEPSFDSEPSASLTNPVPTSTFKFGISASAPVDNETSKSTIPPPIFGFGPATGTPVKETTKPLLDSSPIKFGIEPEAPPKTPIFGGRTTTSYLKAPGSPEAPEAPAPVVDPTKFSFEPFSGGPRKRKNAEPVQSDGPKVSIFGSPSAPVPTPQQQPPVSLPSNVTFTFGVPTGTPKPAALPVTSTSTAGPAQPSSLFGAPGGMSTPGQAGGDVLDQGTSGTKRSHGEATEPSPKKSAFIFGAQQPGQEPRPVPVPVAVPVSNSSPATGFNFGAGTSAGIPSFGNTNSIFNQGNPVPAPAIAAPAPATPFTFNPGNLNLNFGSPAGPAAPNPAVPALFAFSATPTAQTDGGGAQRRPFKKAHRRIR